MKKSSLLIIFLTVFIDLIGFGIVIPLLPRYADQFGASGLEIGFIISSYSIAQFFFSPFWGKLSDRIGRRPIILISTAGSTFSYVLFAIASQSSELWMLLLSRTFAGTAGANLSVASAYIADMTSEKNRSKGMSLIGIAFGLGFILGPAIGAFSAKGFGTLSAPGWVAATICGTNFILACLMLGESRKATSQSAVDRPKFEQWKHTFKQAQLGFLIGIFFLAIFCFACFESTLPLLLHHFFEYDQTQLGYFFAYCGLIALIVQGAVGRLVKRFGEPLLICVSLIGVSLSLALLPFATSLPKMLIALGLYSAFSGINRAPTMGMISLAAPKNEQGITLGVAQSAGTLARIYGPLFAATLYEFKIQLPYVICAFFALIASFLTWIFLIKVRSSKTS